MTVKLSFRDNTSLTIYRAVLVDIRDWHGIKSYFISYCNKSVRLLKCFPFSTVTFCEIKSEV